MSEINDLKDGFNAGYIIRKHKPQLYEQLNHAIHDVDLPFFQSFIDGGEELTKEHIKNLMQKDSMQKTHDLFLNKETSSKDQIEPDIGVWVHLWRINTKYKYGILSNFF